MLSVKIVHIFQGEGMNKKAEKFQNFIKSRHLEQSFAVSEHQANGRDFVIFESSVSVKKEHLRLMLILDQGLQTVVRMWIRQDQIALKDERKLLQTVANLNLNYRSFKFSLDQDHHVVMDWINSSSDESFDPDLVHFMLGVINREGSAIYNLLQT